MRLTRRGRLVLASLAVLAAAGLLAVIAPAAAQRQSGLPSAVPAGVPATVVVQPGDTLWSIARRVAPDRDARLVVADIRRFNALASVEVRTGQRLRLHAP